MIYRWICILAILSQSMMFMAADNEFSVTFTDTFDELFVFPNTSVSGDIDVEGSPSFEVPFAMTMSCSEISSSEATLSIPFDSNVRYFAQLSAEKDSSKFTVAMTPKLSVFLKIDNQTTTKEITYTLSQEDLFSGFTLPENGVITPQEIRLTNSLIELVPSETFFEEDIVLEDYARITLKKANIRLVATYTMLAYLNASQIAVDSTPWFLSQDSSGTTVVTQTAQSINESINGKKLTLSGAISSALFQWAIAPQVQFVYTFDSPFEEEDDDELTEITTEWITFGGNTFVSSNSFAQKTFTSESSQALTVPSSFNATWNLYQ